MLENTKVGRFYDKFERDRCKYQTQNLLSCKFITSGFVSNKKFIETFSWYNKNRYTILQLKISV